MNSAAEKPWIDYFGAGPLFLSGLGINQDYVKGFKIRAGGNDSGVLMVQGCIFPNTAPFYEPQHMQRRIAFGNFGVPGEGRTVVPLEDEFSAFNGAIQRLSLSLCAASLALARPPRISAEARP